MHDNDDGDNYSIDSSGSSSKGNGAKMVIDAKVALRIKECSCDAHGLEADTL